MGQSNARQRLEIIKENVDAIAEKIKSDELTLDDRNRSHDILLDYIKEIKFILSKSLRPSKIQKAEKLIIAALQELATLEGTFKNVEPRLKAKSLQTLHEIEKNMKTISAALTNKNLETEKETINNYKKRISLIQDVDQEVDAKKYKVLDVVCSVENTFNELEIEETLKKAERKHDEGRLDLNRFVGVSESNCYKNYKKHLSDLKKEVNQIPDISTKIVNQKSYLLFNINNNMTALDKKIRENEENIRRKTINREDFNVPVPHVTNLNLIENVARCYLEFEKLFSANCSLHELQDVFKTLTKMKIKIDQKLKVLEHQIQDWDTDICGEVVPVQESKCFTVKKYRNCNEGPIALPRNITRMKEIQNAVTKTQQQILKCRFSVDTEMCKNIKTTLQNYKTELNNLHLKHEDQEFADTVSQQIDNVTATLTNNLLDFRNVSGDVLIDVMTIGTRVNEFGSNIQETKTLEELKSIEDILLENLYYLKRMKISSASKNICKFRDYLVIQIDSYLSNLENMKKIIGSYEDK